VYSNKTIVGLLGGLWGVELIKKIILKKRRVEIFCFPFCLMMIGRIGCFSMGVFEETYGIPTGLPGPWILGSVMRHPVCL
jgi:hypothetical protein